MAALRQRAAMLAGAESALGLEPFAAQQNVKPSAALSGFAQVEEGAS